jgi:hypothetical protein
MAENRNRKKLRSGLCFSHTFALLEALFQLLECFFTESFVHAHSRSADFSSSRGGKIIFLASGFFHFAEAKNRKFLRRE